MKNYEFAIKMELDGEKYYLEQAEINKNNFLHSTFMMLAEDERKHAQLIKDKYNGVMYELEDNNTFEKSMSIFHNANHIKSELRNLPDQVDIYKDALEKEKGSIDLYKGFLAESDNDKSKEFYEFLIEEEEKHYKIIEQMLELYTKHADWVESAEFGLRDES